MGNTAINDMSTSELKKYIKKTEDHIRQLLKEYNDANEEKILISQDIHDLRKRAYNIRELYEYAQWTNDKMGILANVKSSLNIKPRRGEIWTCKLGKNIGSEENKIRPTIIVQNNTGNDRGPTTIIVPISNRPKKIATHIEIRKNDYILVPGEKNIITGTILCEQIKVISKVRLGRHVATLEDDFLNNILKPKLKLSIDV
ncbi:PemK family protein [Clostridium pasteurianum DSM 525 = ATCC 6013]|uniref:PemK family protein n=1 Tax=Clostridium pasteurianum DSM 525 = ATCC 6013 TaxID=1262449 RepID=A0A0H3J5D4_CLOPA|nr:type II toxin-antitoxin system PemK/MazF family toxin [Clostridium pasteurianum]AJA47123.1 PemK family protein [Clostridium pasteurianum DSM 525 = ATCC 6013]AJA51111.1 PemK family protein [Clostridium pasteurianum DSM 525 = ATCC 6013]AOZ74484.1 growth inhibitor PemK [Clostridium pasteurianum DSM 525 = ATCC 6013]AOZ78281.1 growth inhibitor PemK [Clostridium pasteurianum]ELP59488.1 PemK family of DNA-binding proteins [Clostridium pasteurianum DSM 525 = ATCC 6013]